MDSFKELARLRRSIRKFSDEKVDGEDIDTIMRTALMSPSSKGLHSYEFVVVSEKGSIEALARSKAQGSDFLTGAPLAVVVCGDPQVSDTWIEDASVAGAMMLSQVEDLGLGGCWIQIRGRRDAEGKDAEETVRSVLGIPVGIRVLCIIAVGHKGMPRKPQNEERLRRDKVHRERW